MYKIKSLATKRTHPTSQVYHDVEPSYTHCMTWWVSAIQVMLMQFYLDVNVEG